MWLVMGAYLIAGAVRESGLGERIAYAFIIEFIGTVNRCYHLNLCLNLHPCFTDSASLAPSFVDHVP